MNLGYWLYMNEAEGTGLVDTRLGKINAIGKELRKKGYCNSIVPAVVFEELLDKYKLYDITQKEVNYIEERWLS